MYLKEASENRPYTCGAARSFGESRSETEKEMAFESLKAGILLLLEEIEKSPDDMHVLQEALREKLSEMKALGLPVPEDLEEFEQALEESSAEDFFDNLPV